MSYNNYYTPSINLNGLSAEIPNLATATVPASNTEVAINPAPIPTPTPAPATGDACPCNCYDEVVTENWYLADNCPDGNCFPVTIEETETSCDVPPVTEPTLKPDCESIKTALKAKGYSNINGLGNCSELYGMMGLGNAEAEAEPQAIDLNGDITVTDKKSSYGSALLWGSALAFVGAITFAVTHK